jgi:molecular chaperone DnaK
MPKVRSTLSSYFGKDPFQGTDPLEAVAKGAALVAASMMATRQTGDMMPKIGNLTWVESCPFAIGIDTIGNRMSIIIPRGKPLPAHGYEVYVTTVHDQASIAFVIYEGPWLVASRNKELARFTITGIPRAPAGEQSVHVDFLLSIDGILEVKAWIDSVRGSPLILKVNKSSQLFSGERVEAISGDRLKAEEDDKREADRSWRRATIELLSENLRDFLAKEKLGTIAEREKLQAIVDRKIPSSRGGSPTLDQINRVIRELRNAPVLRNRFSIYPRWLDEKSEPS